MIWPLRARYKKKFSTTFGWRSHNPSCFRLNQGVLHDAHKRTNGRYKLKISIGITSSMLSQINFSSAQSSHLQKTETWRVLVMYHESWKMRVKKSQTLLLDGFKIENLPNRIVRNGKLNFKIGGNNLYQTPGRLQFHFANIEDELYTHSPNFTLPM